MAENKDDEIITTSQKRPTTLILNPPMVEVDSAESLEQDDEDGQYTQIKPMHESVSESNILSVPKDTSSFSTPLEEKRTLSSPYILDGYRKKSLYTDLPQKKEYYSLFLLSPTNPVRRLAICITEAKYPFLHDI